MPDLRISVITVCFNAEKTIEKTIRSVCLQTYPNIEYIIIDGASTDKTIEIVNKYSSKINKVVSEKDNGIYEAMNKGLALSTGDVINYLNADDYFYDENVVEYIVKAFESDSSRTLVYGKVELKDVPIGFVPPRGSSIKSINDFQDRTICHQAIFAKRLLFSNVGRFNEKYRYASDFDWLIRAFKYSPSGFYELERKLVCFSIVGRAFQYAETTMNEVAQIRIHYLFSLKNLWYYFRYIMLRGIKKRMLNEKW